MYGIHQNNYGSMTRFHGERVMVVDDSGMNLEMLALVLRDFGLMPEVFQNGSQALMHFFKKKEFYYHFILVDLNMHGVNGFETIKQIRTSARKDGKSVPIYVMTADIIEEDIKRFEEYRINGHISKPVDFYILFKNLNGNLRERK